MSETTPTITEPAATESRNDSDPLQEIKEQTHWLVSLEEQVHQRYHNSLQSMLNLETFNISESVFRMLFNDDPPADLVTDTGVRLRSQAITHGLLHVIKIHERAIYQLQEQVAALKSSSSPDEAPKAKGDSEAPKGDSEAPNASE